MPAGAAAGGDADLAEDVILTVVGHLPQHGAVGVSRWGRGRGGSKDHRHCHDCGGSQRKRANLNHGDHAVMPCSSSQDMLGENAEPAAHTVHSPSPVDLVAM